MRRRNRPVPVDAARLASREPSVWLTPAERVVIAGMVRRAVAGDQDARSGLGRLAPAARFPAVLAETHGDVGAAVGRTERAVVDYRRRLAARDYADATRETGAAVAARFWPLGHVAPHGVEADFTASTTIA